MVDAYDAIVVGARCAGAPTAMLLARRGYRVLLVDRATFPSEIPHGHFIHQSGPRYLQAWGLLDRVVAAGCPPVTAVVSDLGDGPLVGTDLIVDGVALGYGPRRGILDAMLVDAAVTAGADLWEGFVVDGVVRDDDRVTGIRGHSRQAQASMTARATITIGADGRNSRIARAVQAPAYDTSPAATCWYFSYWSSVPNRGLEVYVKPDCLIFAFPTSDGLFAIFVAWTAGMVPRLRQDIDRHFMGAIDQVPELAERVRRGRREERYYGTTDVPNFLRKPFGDGWALVGDAGCHKDPFLALGVCDAFRDADLLVQAIDAGLSGQRPLVEALASYESERNAATLPDYHRNLHLARFGMPPAAYMRQRQVIRGNQALINQFFLANEGMIQPTQASALPIGS